MEKIFAKNLIALAKTLDKPLYAVGGVVRNFLIDGSCTGDFDLAAAIPVEQLVPHLNESGFSVVAEYKRTGTVMFSDGKIKYEYTAFRREKYLGGEHTPSQTEFTENILEDALRRDFKCNAIYYDLKNGVIVDVLGGVSDVKNRVLDTVTDAYKVFSNDGLRLMRLARFAGELNFSPTKQTLAAAKKYADNIKEISPERIYAELNKILKSDTKYPFSSAKGHYIGLKILDDTQVLDRIFPELTKGRGMVQRKDYHLYDVLEHSLRCVLYSPENVRLAALLHDVGKPFCFKRDKNFHMHNVEGVSIAERILMRLKAEKRTVSEVKFFVREHMTDLNSLMRESKIRRFIVKNHLLLSKLLSLKQADFRASLESQEVAPTVKKWQEIYEKMKTDGTPFNLKELKITAKQLMDIGFERKNIGEELEKLFNFAVEFPHKNNFEDLSLIARKDFLKGVK